MMPETQTIFQTLGTEDPLGLWTSVPAPAQAGMVHFGIGDEESSAPPPDVPVFRVNLPANLAASREALRSSAATFEQVNSALDDVPGRLTDLVARTQERQQKQAAGVSFDVQSFEPEPGPEGDLLSLLGDADAEAGAEKASGDVHFGIGEPVSEAWLEAKSRFEALLEQINREVLHFAWVETNLGGRLISRTSVDWSGDAHTVWAEGVNAEQMALHQQTLKIVTQTRNMRLRLFVTVASGATKVAGLLATPGGAVLALPAVYQYVTKIVAQAKQLQSIQSA